MSNFIKVSKTRFYQIFFHSKYESKIQKNIYERTSCPWYAIIDNTTNEIVGRYSDGSWENTFEVILELVSKEDIIAHYEHVLEYKESELESSRKAWRKLRDYKNLSPEARALQDKQEKEERERRKTHPGLMSFMEDDNILSYIPEDFNVNSILIKLREINDNKYK